VKKVAIVAATLIVVIFLCWVGASYYTGGVIARRLPEELRKVEEITGWSYAIKEEDRGIFRSRYVIAMSLPLPADPDAGASPGVISLDMTWHIPHGPLAFKDGSLTLCQALADVTFAIAPDAAPDVSAAAAQIPELLQSSLHAQANFDDTGSLTFTVPPFFRSFVQKNGTPLNVDWKGLTLTVNFAKDNSFTGTLDAPALVLRDPKDDNHRVALSGLSETFSAKVVPGRPHLSTGDVHGVLKSLDVNAPAAHTAFSISDITLNGRLAPRGVVLDYTIDVKGTRHAPDSPDIPANLNIALNSLDPDALNELLGMLQKAGVAKQDPSHEEIVRVASGLLSRSPSITLLASAMEGTPSGPVTLKAQVDTDRMKTLPPSWDRALTQLRVNASLDASETSLLDLMRLLRSENAPGTPACEQCREEDAQSIDDLVTRGHLIRADGKLAAEVVWDGQTLLINGKPLQ